MAVVVGSVVLFAATGKNATLIRNSLLAQAMDESDFAWRPANTPLDFEQEFAGAPEWFSGKWESISNSQDGLSNVVSAIDALHRHSFVGKPIQDDLATTWRLIELEGRGYCADYSKLFTAMMLAAQIPVREWALGHADFGSGHTFNEVFLEGQWVFVDAFNGMLVQDRGSGDWLSVLEFRRRLEEDDLDSIAVVKHTDPRYFFQTSEEGLNYYARSTDYFYMLWGNRVFSYDQSPWVQRAGRVSRSLERLVAVASGDFPGIRLLRTETNAHAVSETVVIRSLLFAALAIELVLGAYLLWLIVFAIAVRKRNSPR